MDPDATVVFNKAELAKAFCGFLKSEAVAYPSELLP
jgi:hypothetical protein